MNHPDKVDKFKNLTQVTLLEITLLKAQYSLVFLFLLLAAGIPAAATIHPFDASSASSGSASTTSATYASIQAFNFTPLISNKTHFFAYVTLTTSKAGGANTVGQWRITVNGVEQGNATRTLTTSGQNLSIVFSSLDFTANSAAVVNISIDHLRQSGGGTITSSQAKTIIYGMNDVDTTAALSDTNYTINSATASSTLSNLANFSYNSTYNGTLILLWDVTEVKSGGAGTITYLFKAAYPNGTTVSCVPIVRTSTNGLTNNNGGSCIVSPNITANTNSTLHTIQLWAKNTAGTSTFGGHLHAFTYGGVQTDANQTNLTGSNINATSLTQVKNTTLTVSFDQHDIVATAGFTANGTAANMEALFELQLVNTSSGSVIGTSTQEERSFTTLGESGVKVIQTVFSNLSIGNYTVKLLASVNTANLTFTGGALTAFAADSVRTTATVLPPSPVTFFAPLNVTDYEVYPVPPKDSAVFINYSNASSPSNLTITGFDIFLINASTNRSLLLIAGNTTSLAYQWNSTPFTSVTGNLPPNWNATGNMGQYAINITAWQSDGQRSISQSQTFTLEAEIQPLITAISVTPASPTKSTNLSCNVTYYDQDDNNATAFVNWYKNGTNQTNLASSANITNSTATIVSSVNVSFLTKGNNWACAAYTYDEGVYSTYNFTSNVTVQNSAPFIFYATIFTYASNQQDFNATAGVFDADGGSDIVTAAITKNGTTVCSYASNVTSGNIFNVTFNCTASGPTQVNITFTDSSGASVATNPAVSNFNNTAPSVTQPYITPASPNKTSTLTCINGTFIDPLGHAQGTSEFRWYVNGVLVNQPFSNATTLNNSNFNKGDRISCSQIPFDQFGQPGTANMSANVTIQNSPPAIAYNASFANGTADHWFTATAGATDSDGVSDFAGASISDSNCAFLSNQTSGSIFNATFNCTSAYQATSTPTITFTDSSAATAITASASNAYPDNAPTLAQPFIFPSSPLSTQTLTCGAGSFSDIDNDQENASAITWAWYRNGALITGQNTETLAPAFFTKNDAVNCSETTQAQNWSSKTATNISTAVAVQDIAPAIAAIAIQPSSAFASTNLTCNLTVTDADDTASNVSIFWYKNGSNQTPLAASYTSLVNNTATIVSTLNASNLVKGNNWACAAVAFDGFLYSGLNFSSNVTIQNTAPFVFYATTFVYAPNNRDFNATAGVYDADGGGDIVTATIATNATACSYKSNVTSGYIFNVSFNCTATDRSQVNITFIDSSGASVTTVPALSEFNDTPPSVTQPYITPASPNKTSTLTCNNGTFSDVNNDFQLFSEYRWYRNGILIIQPFINATTLNNSNFNKGDTVSCSQTPFDEHGLGGAANMSSNVTVQDSPPVIAYNVSFANASSSHSFTATAGVTDQDSALDIAGTNISDGNCTYLSNSTAGNSFNATFNCVSAQPATSTLAISFNDTTGAFTTTASASNSYPDNAPTLGQPTITPLPPNKTTSLTCNNGAFADIDSDLENASAITRAWYRNGSLISGQTGATLAPANFGKSDSINCIETTQAQTWNLFTASGTSDNATIQNAAPTTPTGLSPAGGETFTAPSSISISWAASTDPDGNPITYTIDYSSDSGATWNSITPSTAASPYSWSALTLPIGIYRIRIAANDSTDISPYAQSGDFTIGSGTPAPTPTPGSDNGGGSVSSPPAAPSPPPEQPQQPPSNTQNQPSQPQQPNASQGMPQIIVPENIVVGQQVEIKTLDASGAPLAGQELTVTAPDGNTITLITGPDGIATFTASQTGDYKFSLAGAQSATANAAPHAEQQPGAAEQTPAPTAPQQPVSQPVSLLAFLAIGAGIILIAAAVFIFLAKRRRRGL